MLQHKPKSKKHYLFVGLVFIVLVILNKVDFDFFSSDKSQKKASVEVRTQKEVVQIDNGVYFLPTSTTNQIVQHSTYYLAYSEQHEQAEAVAYELKPEHISGGKHNRPYFNQDPKVSSESAHWKNYKNSGYTRGHLLPAGDRVFSKEAYDETFYTSNISPQLAEFNTGIWNSLEMRIRNFVKKNGKVYIITGGVLTDALPTIGNEKVSVPDYFYKVVLYNDGSQYKMLAYLIPHKEEKRKPLQDYVITTDSVEALTGIDFFHFLDDTLEDELEAAVDYKWFVR